MSEAPMRAGKLRNRIEIQERTVAQDSYGDGELAWKTVAVRWGSIEPLSGRELWQANQSRPDVTTRVTLRYYAGLTPRHRLKMGDRILGIEGAINTDNLRREHVLSCREEV